MFWVRGYGWTERCDCTQEFNCIVEVNEPLSKKSFMEALEKESGLSPYRPKRDIVILEIVKMS